MNVLNGYVLSGFLALLFLGSVVAFFAYVPVLTIVSAVMIILIMIGAFLGGYFLGHSSERREHAPRGS
jgi:hypothetical protein